MRTGVMGQKVRIHFGAPQHRHGARGSPEAHRIQRDESLQFGKPVQEREADGAGIEAVDVWKGIVSRKVIQCVDTRAVILQQGVSNP